jgi:predicted DNA-binding WGR domain protein
MEEYRNYTTFAEEAYSGENLNVLVLQDTSRGFAKIWYVDEHHNKKLLRNWGEVDMGSHRTLRRFVEFSKENYPAERYIISLYNHGGGWQGACIDNTNMGWLLMDEMQKALTEAGGVDIICFSAPCLMGALECVYELRDCVEVYIGSEEGSVYNWWMYIWGPLCETLNQNPDISTIEVGAKIIELIEEDSYKYWASMREHLTMSAIRTDKIGKLVESVDKLAHHLVDNFPASYDPVWKAYENTLSFMRNFCIDLYDFAEEYSQVETNQTIIQALQDVKNHVSDAVIAECHGSAYTGAFGLSIYFSPAWAMWWTFGQDLNYTTSGLDFAEDTYWDEFLHTYINESKMKDPDGPCEGGLDDPSDWVHLAIGIFTLYLEGTTYPLKELKEIDDLISLIVFILVDIGYTTLLPVFVHFAEAFDILELYLDGC